MQHEFLKIMKSITGGKKELMKELEECISNTDDYFNNHREQFEDRGIGEEDLTLEEILEEEDLSKEEVWWITLIDILEREGYVAERDCNDYMEDFIYFVGNLNGVKSKDLKIEEQWFDEEGEMTEWLEILDEKWEKDGMAMFAFDMDSDSYVLFPYSIEEIKQLEEWAEEAGFRIDYAKNM